MTAVAVRLAVVCLIAFLSVGGAAAGALEDCNSNDMDKRITGCTKALKNLDFNKKNLALLYAKRGQAYFTKEDYDRAIADFTKCIELRPKDFACYSLRADAYAQKEDHDRVIPDATKCLELSPKDTACLGVRGGAYADKGDNDRALADLSKCVELNPKDISCLTNKALVHSRKQEKDEVIDIYLTIRRVMDEKTDLTDEQKVMLVFVDVELVRSLVERADGHYNKVVQALGSAQAPAGGLDDAHKQALERAVADADKCLEVLPGDPTCHARRALYLDMLGRRAEAIADATKAHTEDPKNLDALAFLGQAAFADKEFDKSLKLAKEWQALAPGDSKAAALVGKSLEALGRKDEAAGLTTLAEARTRCNAAIEALQQGKETDLDAGIAGCTASIEAPGIDNASLVTFLEYRAVLHGRKKNHEGAVADYTRCLELAGGEGENVIFYQERGINLVDLGQFERAVADFDAALKQVPNDTRMLEFRGYSLVQLGAKDKAKADFTALIKLDPKHANAYAGLGDIERDAENFDAAVAHYGKVIEFGPTATAYSLRAAALEKLGRKDEAIVDHRKALSLEPGFAPSADALKRLGATP